MRTTFKSEQSPVPDDFHLVLMHISIHTRQYWRVMRLQAMSPEAREAAGLDIEPYLRKPDSYNRNESRTRLTIERSGKSDTDLGHADGIEKADVHLENVEKQDLGGDMNVFTGQLRPHADVALVLGSDGSILCVDVSPDNGEQHRGGLWNHRRRKFGDRGSPRYEPPRECMI
ncbi:hypothetical protein BDW22DRAFT_232115 [Trametopsis cervina]|nr:hypothetical protein BDW22DRAFT_232115 [Trametopsis cervina]